MNTKRINHEIDLTVAKILAKPNGVKYWQTTVDELETKEHYNLIPGDQLLEKAQTQVDNLKNLILQDIPTFRVGGLFQEKYIQYRLNRDKFDAHKEHYLLNFIVPTTNDFEFSLWDLKFKEE